MTRCEDVRVELGGYALDGLTEQERTHVEAHLRTCRDCWAEARELTALPPLLDLVEEAPPPPPAHLRERVLSATARRRASRRRLATLVAAALLAGAVIGGGLAVAFWPTGSGEAISVALAGEEAFDADGVAELRETDDGLRVHLELDGVEPLAEPGVYEAWLSRPDAEEPISIGRFSGSPEGSVDLSLRAEGRVEDYAYIWVTAEPDAASSAHEGPTVLAAPLHPEDEPEAD